MNAAVVGSVRWLLKALAALRQRWRESDDVEYIDTTTLRDLGLDRSELGSCHAEAMGVAPSTRRRLATPSGQAAHAGGFETRVDIMTQYKVV
jgi:hypothetical protein